MKRLIIFLFIGFILSCSSANEPKNSNDTDSNKINSIHVALGVPKDNDSSDDYIIIRPQYVLSYNKNKNVSNWVAWELDKDWFGNVERYQGNFITDTSLPAGFYRVKHDDYTNSGYDRGHLVRSEERTNTVENNISTFILTNIIPQTPDLNRGVWLDFEYYCQNFCQDENKQLYIIAGGIFHSDSTIGNGVSVPDSCFKIIVVLEKGKGLNDVSVNTTVIAVVMPNIAGIRNDKWDKYKTTVRLVENSTGYNFLSCVPVSVQDVIENNK